jgi:D-threonine aldolase
MQVNEYEIVNVNELATPALAVYPSVVQNNIQKAVALIGSNILRPHIKTCKTPEVVQMLINAGVNQFKCATIAEAEMLASVNAKDILLAYQPVAVNIQRLKSLMANYPASNFGCLVDNIKSAEEISSLFIDSPINIFIDLNIGMNRTGVLPYHAAQLIDACIGLKGIVLKGIHAYDGHINDVDVMIRKRKADAVFDIAWKVKLYAENVTEKSIELVIGGTPAFQIHAQRTGVTCSPGTFVFWDAGYSVFTDLPFKVAAVLLTRIISIPDNNYLCLDLGHKAVAAENPLEQRVKFLNVNNAEVVSQSEEHLVVKVPDTSVHTVGDVWYAVPFHICPTVALYNELQIIEKGYSLHQWKVTARNRKINI